MGSKRKKSTSDMQGCAESAIYEYAHAGLAGTSNGVFRFRGVVC
jgi:hypothetical protein